MGSSSDWETMQHAVDVLERFGVPYEKHIVSAHRTPVWMAEFASGAEGRGIEVVIAGAGGSVATDVGIEGLRSAAFVDCG